MPREFLNDNGAFGPDDLKATARNFFNALLHAFVALLLAAGIVLVLGPPVMIALSH